MGIILISLGVIMHEIWNKTDKMAHLVSYQISQEQLNAITW